MAELDRNRPFDKVWGIVGEGEPYFFQDGKSFDSDGIEIVTTPVVEAAPVTAPQVEAEKPKKKAAKKADAVELADENHDLL